MRRHLTTLMMLCLGIGLLGLSGQQHRELLDLREDLHLNEAPPLENMKPGTAVAVVALGAFRGIVADVLWIRASRMQEEGQYFELVQLADWITQLEPRFPEVWAFQAWNMTYNISVLFNTPEERWRWVRHGIELLRDEGLYHNPASAGLHWELGWFFQHKIGQNLDQMHWHYKTEWYDEMHDLFDGPAPDYFSWVEYPSSRNELREYPGMQALLDTLKTRDIDPLNADEFAGVHTELDEALGRVIAGYHKRQLLEKRYKMDLALMEEIDLMYGPLDWRTPFPHAVYWGFRGLEKAKRTDRSRLQRMIFQSMAQAFRNGTYYPNEGRPYYTPNLSMLDNALQAYERGLEELPDDRTYQNAHKNFLSEAIHILDMYGQRSRAQILFDILRERYPDEINAAPYIEFIAFLSTQEDLTALSLSEATAFIEGLLVQSLVWQALDQPDLAAGMAEQAKGVYAQYMEAKKKSEEFNERMGLPPMKELLDRARERARQSIQNS